MLEDIKEIKIRITKEWLNSVPQLAVFTQNKLYKINGCSIIGIELIKLLKLEEYRPHFVLYPLWKSDLKSCLDNPYILIEITNKKGLQFSIPYLKNDLFFNEAVECLKKQAPILFNEVITIPSLFDLIDSCFNDILVKSNAAQQAKLFEVKFHASLYTGNHAQVEDVFKQIQLASKNWNMQMFEIWYGKFEIWLEMLREKVNSRDELLKQIEANKQEKKILQLKNIPLI